MSSGSDWAVKDMRETARQATARRITDGGEVDKSALDVQEGGSHYKSWPIQPIEYTMKNKLNFCIGNVIKYATRAGHLNKVKALEDLRKARHYLELEAELTYGEKL